MLNFENNPRRVGVELEFHGLSPEKCAELIKSVFGGDIKKHHNDLYEVKTSLGDFKVETDLRLIKSLSKESQENQSLGHSDTEGFIRDLIKGLSDEFVPTELISPPLEFDKLDKIKDLEEKLRENGADGTIDSFRFAFGAQLNPEVVSLEADSILKYLKAFLILSDWLKGQIHIDITRKISSFASDFPKDYQVKILDPNYSPDLQQLISDYLNYNPTRNRSLDLLPLFAFIDEDKVREAVPKQKINSRPTFHYRLPNSQISLPTWSICLEWSRWQTVETLAENKEKLRLGAQLTLDHLKGATSGSQYSIEINNLVETLR